MEVEREVALVAAEAVASMVARTADAMVGAMEAAMAAVARTAAAKVGVMAAE